MKHEPFRKPTGLTADASKVTPRQFMDAIGLDSPEERAERAETMRRQCIAAIQRGDTWGWPPVFVAQCRKLMAPELSKDTKGLWQ